MRSPVFAPLWAARRGLVPNAGRATPATQLFAPGRLGSVLLLLFVLGWLGLPGQ